MAEDLDRMGLGETRFKVLKDHGERFWESSLYDLCVQRFFKTASKSKRRAKSRKSSRDLSNSRGPSVIIDRDRSIPRVGDSLSNSRHVALSNLSSAGSITGSINGENRDPNRNTFSGFRPKPKRRKNPSLSRIGAKVNSHVKKTKTASVRRNSVTSKRGRKSRPASKL